MQLELNDAEMRTLIEVLESRMRALRYEIMHTGSHEYKDRLKNLERVLQCLHDKLITYDSLNVA